MATGKLQEGQKETKPQPKTKKDELNTGVKKGR
jgi:hypothetical protein